MNIFAASPLAHIKSEMHVANDAPTKERMDHEERLHEPRGVTTVRILKLLLQYNTLVLLTISKFMLKSLINWRGKGRVSP